MAVCGGGWLETTRPTRLSSFHLSTYWVLLTQVLEINNVELLVFQASVSLHPIYLFTVRFPCK